MPTYDFVCRNCEHTLDVLQKISDDPLVDCPECGEPQLKRQLSAPRFRLKGSGWYMTDYADKKKTSKEEAPEKKEKVDSSAQKETKKEKTDSKAGNEKKKESKSEPKSSEKSKE